MNEELLAKVLSGEADPAEVARFLEAAEKDDALRQRFVELAELDGMLGVALEDEFSRERRHLQIMQAVGESERDEFVVGVETRLKQRRWAVRFGSIAAVLALAFTGWLVFGKDQAVATVARLETVTWGDGAPIQTGKGITKGHRLRFASGLVELQVGARGRMVVEGPADLEFTAPDRSVLRRGRVVMRVTPAGHGYRMETPQGAVVDLGTEFGVAVGDDGKVETHVLEGEVEAYPNGGGMVLLKRDDALSFSNGGERIKADGGEFYTSLPPVRGSKSQAIHWSFDDPSDPGDLELKRMNDSRLPEYVDGRFGKAMSFDGKGAYAESPFKGIGGGQSRTVSFWVKVPKDFSLREGFAVMSWGRFAAEKPGEVWQIAINPTLEQGPAGRLRVGTHEGQVVGSTDLRDDQWHHVAVVLYGGSQPDVGTHVLVYLDGSLEPISRRALQEIRTEVEKAKHGVWLGRDITYGENTVKRVGGFFRGEVDEAYIFDSALTREDIRALREHNAPPK